MKQDKPSGVAAAQAAAADIGYAMQTPVQPDHIPDAGKMVETPTNHDAAPAAKAVSDEDRTDKAATSHRDDGTGDTPVTEPIPKGKRDEVSYALTEAEREAIEWFAEVHKPLSRLTKSNRREQYRRPARPAGAAGEKVIHISYRLA